MVGLTRKSYSACTPKLGKTTSSTIRLAVKAGTYKKGPPRWTLVGLLPHRPRTTQPKRTREVLNVSTEVYILHQLLDWSQMGVVRGFDLFPPLEDKASDNEKWAAFLNAVTSHYEDEGDRNMRIDEKGNIMFDVGEGPALQRKGYEFRRFWSKTSGSGRAAEEYIAQVEKIAKRYFGPRISTWDESFDECGVYGWDEVYSAAYEYFQIPSSKK